MGTWIDLRDQVRATGAIPTQMVDKIAVDRTEAELTELRRLGIPRTYDAEYVYQRTLVEQQAKAALDGLEAARMLARVSPAERAARTFELRAELAEKAIPPNPARAAYLRDVAAVLRASSYLAAADHGLPRPSQAGTIARRMGCPPRLQDINARRRQAQRVYL